MVNTEDFTLRLQKVMEYYNESASSFAESIGVQRSSISHILSGRNKPSLEFVLKILTAYPEVDLYWLLNGKGNFPKSSKTLFDDPQDEIRDSPEAEIKEEKTIKTKKEEVTAVINSEAVKTSKTIERIVIFYTDGSFKNFENP
ncbi:helix-turn-helix domain-containing protein [Mangrovimonas aestuarii]|uniref:helix-turn-helix domain-containing protein n=1 Tax=Mangrovimonas aestuarii TaxID=3018443 RepID=UPI00237895A0|nr:helix-turn-helix transcriptional regulator [Mangrovimonas aestuarii]